MHTSRAMRWLADLRGDIPYALRGFAREPGFCLVALLTLALGIGANAAIFATVRAVLLKPLEYAPDSDRLVRLMAHFPPGLSRSGEPRRAAVGVTPAEAREIQARARTVSQAGTVGPALLGLSGFEEGARLRGARVSASIFPMLRAVPVLGRPMLPADEEPGGTNVILLSHATWLRFFSGNRDVVGRTVLLDTVLGPRTQRRYTVIGVMPPSFTFPDARTAFWTPPSVPAGGEGAGFRGPLVARLADGITIQAAADELAPLVRALRQHAADVRYELVREQDEVGAPVRPALIVLTIAVGFVLLIACVNVANLLLARAAARRREIAVRAALGAGRSRLVRQVLTESVLLAALGGTVGTAVALAGVSFLRRLATTLSRIELPGATEFPRLSEVTIDPSVLAFTTAVALLTGVVFGLAPALRLSRTDPIEALRNAVRSSSMRRGSGTMLGGGLLVVQSSMAMVLLVGAGLLIHSFGKLTSVDPGYDADGVLTFQVALPTDQYPDARLTAFAEDLVERLRSVPGVKAAGFANQLPMVQLRDTFGVRKAPSTRPPSSTDGADARFVSRGYLAAMGVRVVEGRGFREEDRPERSRVVLINEALARRDFGGQNPLGTSVYIGSDPRPWQIVGIVDDVRQFGLEREAEPQFFADLRQSSGVGPLFPLGAYYVVRIGGEPEAIVSSVRTIVRDMEPNGALFNVAPMNALVAATIARPRMYAVLLGIFAAVGVVLALVGIYGVVAYAVTQRTREIGIRMALGARRGEVMRMVLRQALTIVAAGILVGLLGGAATTRYLEGLLFGVTPLDPATFAAASIAFALIAAFASYLPARRATRVDPVVAIRSE